MIKKNRNAFSFGYNENICTTSMKEKKEKIRKIKREETKNANSWQKKVNQVGALSMRQQNKACNKCEQTHGNI